MWVVQIRFPSLLRPDSQGSSSSFSSSPLSCCWVTPLSPPDPARLPSPASCFHQWGSVPLLSREGSAPGQAGVAAGGLPLAKEASFLPSFRPSPRGPSCLPFPGPALGEPMSEQTAPHSTGELPQPANEACQPPGEGWRHPGMTGGASSSAANGCSGQ